MTIGSKKDAKATYVIAKSQIIGPNGGKVNFGQQAENDSKANQRRQAHRVLKKTKEAVNRTQANSLQNRSVFDQSDI